MTSRRTLLGGAATLAAASLLPRRGRAQGKTFVIGSVLPLTGVYAGLGKLFEVAQRVGVAELNEHGGILGRQVELMIRDSAGNPQRSLLGAQELVEDQKVDFLYPELPSPNSLAVLPWTTERKMITITNSATPRVGNVAEFPYSFQLGDLATKRVPAMIAAIKQMGGKRVGVLVATNPATVATGQQMVADLPKWGLESAGYKTYAVDAKDVTALVQSVRDAGADIIAFDSASREGIPVVMSAMQTLGWKAKVVGEPAMLSGDLREQVPAAVADRFFCVNYRAAVRTGPVRPELEKFIAAIKAAGPVQNIGFSGIARDIFFMAKYGYEKAQQSQASVAADAVRAVLESIGTAHDFPPAYSLILGNPNWTAKDHSAANVDYSKLWGLVKVSTPVDGIYEGTELNFTEPA